MVGIFIPFFMKGMENSIYKNKRLESGYHISTNEFRLWKMSGV